ncbi:unnamed protein product [Calypogeia fissa]
MEAIEISLRRDVATNERHDEHYIRQTAGRLWTKRLWRSLSEKDGDIHTRFLSSMARPMQGGGWTCGQGWTIGHQQNE